MLCKYFVFAGLDRLPVRMWRSLRLHCCRRWDTAGSHWDLCPWRLWYLWWNLSSESALSLLHCSWCRSPWPCPRQGRHAFLETKFWRKSQRAHCPNGGFNGIHKRVYCPNGGLMLVHRLRRWPNTKPPLGHTSWAEIIEWESEKGDTSIHRKICKWQSSQHSLQERPPWKRESNENKSQNCRAKPKGNICLLVK